MECKKSKIEGTNIEYTAVERINLPLFDLDLLILRGHETISKALKSGDLVRLEDACPKMQDMPWVLRVLFPPTRFYSKEYESLFLPIRSSSNEKAQQYQVVREYLDEKFMPDAFDMNDYAKTAVDVLVNKPQSEETDVELGKCFARAIATRFMPDCKQVDEDVLNTASKQVGDLSHSLIPWKRVSGGKAVKCAYKYMHEQVVAKEDRLPDAATVDIAHSIFASLHLGPKIMRQIQRDPSIEFEDMMSRLVPTRNTLRMSLVDTNLGGLLKHPIRARKTLVIIQFYEASQEVKNLSYVFGSGNDERRCAAQGTIVDFFNQVRSLLIEAMAVKKKESVQK